jgi:hypothetical protein
MEKKMIHRLTAPFTHITPIDHNDMPLYKVVHGKNLPEGGRPCKESRFQRNLNSLNTISREGSGIMTDKDVVERSNIKQLSFGEGSTKLVFSSLSESKGVQ